MQGGKDGAGGIGKLRFQCGKITRHGEFLAIGVDHLEIHVQMRWQSRRIPLLAWYRQTFLPKQERRQRIGQRHLRLGQVAHAILRCDDGNELTDRFRHWHDLAAQALRQGLEQCRRFFAQHAHYQPVEARRIHLIQYRYRQGDGDAIHDVCWFKPIAEWVCCAAMVE